MEMNSFILFFISIPEAFFNLVIILLLAGEKGRLKLSVSNAVRFFSSLALMVTTSWFIRPIVPNVAVNFLVHAIAYAIILSLLYWTDIRKFFFSVLLLALFSATIENSFFPYLIAYVFKGIENYKSSNINILLCATPMRVVQIGMIVLLWKYHVALAFKNLNIRFFNLFIFSLLILTFAEYYFSYIFVAQFGSFTLFQQLLFSTSLLLMTIVFNLLVFKFIYTTIKGIVTQGFKQYQTVENIAEQAFKEVYGLIKVNDVIGASRLLEKLIYEKEHNRRR